MKRNKKVDIFNDSYFVGKVTSSIYNAKVSKPVPNLTKEELASKYAELGITQLDKDYFYKNSSFSTIEKDKFWKNYSKREDLIKTGQYEEIRENMYKDNYINALIKNNVNKKYIEFFKSLTIEDWKKVAYVPNSKKGEKEKFKLPSIPLYYEGKSVVNNRDSNESDLDATINGAGMSSMFNKIVKSMEKMKRKPRNAREKYIFEAVERYDDNPRNNANITARVIGTLPRDIRDSITFSSNSEYEYENRYKIYLQLEAKGRLYNKYGNIPFVKNSEKRGYLYWKANNNR